MDKEIDKTKFTFTDQFGESSLLTLDKWVADPLQEIVGDVHYWIQLEYEKITEKCIEKQKQLTRLAIGNIIRKKAITLISKYIDI